MKRTWNDLWKEAREAGPSTEEAATLALQKFNTTPEGEAFREWLASIVMGPDSSVSEGAWQQNKAERDFAERLLRKMESATNATNGRSSTS